MFNRTPPTFTLPVTRDGYWQTRHPDTPEYITGQLYFRMFNFTANSNEVDRWLHCRFYFDPKCWDVDKFGLIYLNQEFLDELQQRLENHGFQYAEGINYSEQGMQGGNYIDFDVKSDKELFLDLLATDMPVYSRWPETSKQKVAA